MIFMPTYADVDHFKKHENIMSIASKVYRKKTLLIGNCRKFWIGLNPKLSIPWLLLTTTIIYVLIAKIQFSYMVAPIATIIASLLCIILIIIAHTTEKIQQAAGYIEKNSDGAIREYCLKHKIDAHVFLHLKQNYKFLLPGRQFLTLVVILGFKTVLGLLPKVVCVSYRFEESDKDCPDWTSSQDHLSEIYSTGAQDIFIFFLDGSLALWAISVMIPLWFSQLLSKKIAQAYPFSSLGLVSKFLVNPCIYLGKYGVGMPANWAFGIWNLASLRKKSIEKNGREERIPASREEAFDISFSGHNQRISLRKVVIEIPEHGLCAKVIDTTSYLFADGRADFFHAQKLIGAKLVTEDADKPALQLEGTLLDRQGNHLDGAVKFLSNELYLVNTDRPDGHKLTRSHADGGCKETRDPLYMKLVSCQKLTCNSSDSTPSSSILAHGLQVQTTYFSDLSIICEKSTIPAGFSFEIHIDIELPSQQILLQVNFPNHMSSYIRKDEISICRTDAAPVVEDMSIDFSQMATVKNDGNTSTYKSHYPPHGCRLVVPFSVSAAQRN